MINKYLFASVATLLASTMTVEAIPADPRPRQYTQPDGTTVTLKMKGDEHQHYLLTEDDYIVVKNSDGYYCYAVLGKDGALTPSSYKANPEMLRTKAEEEFLATLDNDGMMESFSRSNERRMSRRRQPAKNIGKYPDANFPCIGSPKVLIVLVEYQDVKFSIDKPDEYFYRMLNEPGFRDYGATGSIGDYFRDNSNGAFNPEFDVYGPVTLPKKRAYYGGNDENGNDKHPEEMVIDACTMLDSSVDFSRYDCDGDGWVDNVYVYYAGVGEASSYEVEDAVWPHAYNISYNYDALPLDGVLIDRYACSNELVNEWGDPIPDGIGAFVHEFSHVMGLPDLYVTDTNSKAFTPGEWTVMDQGSYNNDSRTPPAYTSYERYALGWIEPKHLGGREENVSLDNIMANQACMIPTPYENEFYLLENRQQTGWDEFIPGHGMLIWHIQYDEDVWYNNAVNNDSKHQYVDLIEADDRRSERNRNADSFPGVKNITSFTAETTPALKTWAGDAIDCPITDISETDGVISFVACKGQSGIASVGNDGANISVSADGIYISAPGVPVEVFSIAGIRVFEGIGDCHAAVAPGSYIVKCGQVTKKVVVR